MGIKQELGNKIKKLRKQHKLTQEQFSEMINIAPRTLYGIESGKNFVTAETLEKIIDVLHVSSADLFETETTTEEMYSYIKNNLNQLKATPQRLTLFYHIFKDFLNHY